MSIAPSIKKQSWVISQNKPSSAIYLVFREADNDTYKVGQLGIWPSTSAYLDGKFMASTLQKGNNITIVDQSGGIVKALNEFTTAIPSDQKTYNFRVNIYPDAHEALNDVIGKRADRMTVFLDAELTSSSEVLPELIERVRRGKVRTYIITGNDRYRDRALSIGDGFFPKRELAYGGFQEVATELNLCDGNVMLVANNSTIAKDYAEDLCSAGCKNVMAFSSTDAALADFMRQYPDVLFVDLDLFRDNMTGERFVNLVKGVIK